MKIFKLCNVAENQWDHVVQNCMVWGVFHLNIYEQYIFSATIEEVVDRMMFSYLNLCDQQFLLSTNAVIVKSNAYNFVEIGFG